MKRLVTGLLAAGLFAGCAHTVKTPPAPVGGPPPIQAWENTLSRYVSHAGYVDFAGLSQNLAELDRYIGWAASNGPNTMPEKFHTREKQLAYHINTYNALAMRLVVEKGIPQRLGLFRKVDFFYLTKVQVDGERISLYAYENDVIRAFNEPRIHFALNCMSVGCPRLPREAFAAEKLDEQLDRETRNFFAAKRNLRIDDKTRTVYINELLEWFEEDFLLVAPSLTAFVNRYIERPIPEDYRVEFLPYDWTVVRQAIAPS